MDAEIPISALVFVKDQQAYHRGRANRESRPQVTMMTKASSCSPHNRRFCRMSPEVTLSCQCCQKPKPKYRQQLLQFPVPQRQQTCLLSHLFQLVMWVGPPGSVCPTGGVRRAVLRDLYPLPPRQVDVLLVFSSLSRKKKPLYYRYFLGEEWIVNFTGTSICVPTRNVFFVVSYQVLKDMYPVNKFFSCTHIHTPFGNQHYESAIILFGILFRTCT